MHAKLSGFFKKNAKLMIFLLRVSDVVWVIGGLFVVIGFSGEQFDTVYLVIALIACGIFMVVARFMVVYRSWRLKPIILEPVMAVASWLVAIFFLISILYLFEVLDVFSRLMLFDWTIFTGLCFFMSRFAARFFFRELRRHGRNFRNVIIIGANKQGHQLADLFRNAPWMGMHVLNILDQRDENRLEYLDEQLLASQSPEDMIDIVKKNDVDVVYLALPMRAEERTKILVGKLVDTTASIYLVPDFSDFVTLHTQLELINNIPTFGIIETPIRGYNHWVKTAEDMFLGTLFLILTAIPMMIIAIAIKLSSSGPILFRQSRYGLDGQEFMIWKFQTMVDTSGADTTRQAVKNDPRVTRLGAFLRRTSLDELPQFFNVLQGSMSIVGPRPHPVPLNEEHRKRINGYMLRHKVKPGIAGWAQVNGFRGETETPYKMRMRIEYDLEYIRCWSVWFDLKIILMAIFKGFINKNAY